MRKPPIRFNGCDEKKGELRMAGHTEESEKIEIVDDADQAENEGDEEKSVTYQDDDVGKSDDIEEEEIVVSIGDEKPQQEEQEPAPGWVKELRKANREKEKRIRELEARLNQQTETKPVTLGAKPKLEDHDYDAEKFEVALSEWFEKKRLADAEVDKQRKAEKEQQEAWQARLEEYGKAKVGLKVRDFEDAEEVAKGLLNVTQQGIILQGANNPALVVYALGKNQEKAKKIADIKDPVKFAFAVANLERELKITKRVPAPPPERTINGTGRVSGAVDSTLERLRAEAEKTGDLTKVLQYKRRKQSQK